MTGRTVAYSAIDRGGRCGGKPQRTASGPGVSTRWWLRKMLGDIVPESHPELAEKCACAGPHAYASIRLKRHVCHAT